MVKTTQARIIVALSIVTPLGFASKWYNGPASWWSNDYGGGILYEVFWCLAAILLFPRASAIITASTVFVITCFLETLQLWHPPFLESIRSTFLGSALIGATFAWWDFPHYFIGCTLGWYLISIVRCRVN